MRTKLAAILGLMVVFSLLLAACGPTPVPQTIIQTVEVEKEVEKEVTVVETVEVEKMVEVVKEVTAVPPPEGPEGTLVRALTTFPNSLDLPQCAERNASTTAWHMYDTLLWVNEEGILEPALAKDWEVSEDGSEYTFYLRDDVTFHNGEPFNADAVVFSWERAKDAGFEYSNLWQLATTVEKVDDYTVKITTEGPDALFLTTVADNWAIIPPQYFQEVGQAGFDEHPVGTGPYVFVEWVKGDRIVLKANPDYWREDTPKLENLIFRPIPESATRVAAIQTGEVDIVTRLSSEEAQSLLGVPNVTVIKYAQARVYYIAFNNVSTGVGQPTEDPLVRQAMNYAVDIEAIIDSLFNGFAKPAIGFVATGELGYDNVEPFGYDPDKARELLAEAGYPDGFEMDMACPAGAYTHFEEVCEAVAGYLGEVGIQANLEIMESGHYWELEAAKELPPLFGDSWSATDGEAYRRLIGALGGEEAAYSSWSDEKIIDMLVEIKSTVDQEERAKLYGELQVYMRDNPPFIYLYEPYTFEAINTRVQDYKPRPAENYFLFDTFVVGD
ncbi:MAG: ABC transporter substrate-binding protein [Anaerolineae bacterium]|nr:ABC transporter substrate-binding protein [Anaerolineae bacterium]MDX9831400.1 ABC transporter substrate-binding protein [Anaerolineae bacterium]